MSWYDGQLVTTEGERILAEYDNFGIGELYRHKLVWSSWGPALELATADHTRLPRLFEDTGWGFRRIRVKDPARLRVFFLSLLWRAAETRLREFRDIVVDEPYLSLLRDMVLRGDPEPWHLFPVELIRLSSRGFPHNQTPIPMEKSLPLVDGEGSTLVPHYRFYLDGLIIHFDRRVDRPDLIEKMGSLYVGHGEELTITTVRYEKSFQRRNLETMWAEEEQARERLKENL